MAYSAINSELCKEFPFLSNSTVVVATKIVLLNHVLLQLAFVSCHDAADGA